MDLGGTGIERSVIEQLEHENIDRIKAQRSCATIRSLLEDNDKTWGDPYTRSKELRKIFREEGKLIKAAETNGKRIADKYSLSLNIKPFSEDDREALERMELQSRISAKSSRRDPSDSIFNSGGQSLKKSIKTKKK